NGEIKHLSVFAMARLPLLVYLGSRLDDATDCDIYEPRSTIAPWIWDEESEPVDFHFRCELQGEPTATDAVLIVNASGTTFPIPTELSGLARYVVEPRDPVPQVNTVACRATLGSFERALRSLLGELEQSAKSLKRLHLFAAAPVSVAITLGRAIGWGIHPNLVTYDLNDGEYHYALEITPP
ncbi:MAG: SAVED domain-containing protein, partial [Gemmatimonadetes bacterium]|nr:SAVED domain-containing protein [Gemmatimonadota bacterium]